MILILLEFEDEYIETFFITDEINSDEQDKRKLICREHKGLEIIKGWVAVNLYDTIRPITN